MYQGKKGNHRNDNTIQHSQVESTARLENPGKRKAEITAAGQ